MKTVIRKLTGKPCVIAKAVAPKRGKWACVECACCGIGVEVDLDALLSGPPVCYVHETCYEAATDIELDDMTILT